MSNDNPTRIIRRTRGNEAPVDDATRHLNADERGPAGGRDDEDGPKTRVISGRVGQSDPALDISEGFELVAGWLVIISGKGKGVSCEIYFGMNSIGRGSSERISLDFGDTAISRESHAYIVFDDKQNDFYVQHGGKSNLVRLNGAPVLAPLPLKKGDVIEIGATKMMFIPFCGEDFSWNDAGA